MTISERRFSFSLMSQYPHLSIPSIISNEHNVCSPADCCSAQHVDMYPPVWLLCVEKTGTLLLVRTSMLPAATTTDIDSLEWLPSLTHN